MKNIYLHLRNKNLLLYIFIYKHSTHALTNDTSVQDAFSIYCLYLLFCFLLTYGYYILSRSIYLVVTVWKSFNCYIKALSVDRDNEVKSETTF